MRPHLNHRHLASLGLGLAILPAASAAEGPAGNDAAGPAPAADILEALTNGTPSFATRLRLESVSDDAASDDALALILDTTLGYETGSFEGVSAMLEFEGVHPLGDEDYNSTTNGQTDYPVVKDPTGDEINRLWLRYQGVEDLDLKLGRQRIIYDDARHVGNVGWRANEQTYDGLRGDYSGVDNVHLSAAVLTNINTIGGGNLRTEPAILLHGDYQVTDIGTATAFAYLLDFDEDQNSATDLATFGLRFKGATPWSDDGDITYEAEIAQQSAYADSDDISALHLHLQAGLTYQNYSARLGYELLGSDDGNHGFAFPLGTNHKFNGWADKFLGTPAIGLTDLSLVLAGTWPELLPGKLGAQLHIHKFDSDQDSVDLGSEVDALITYAQNKHLKHGLKLAFYMEGDEGTGKQDTSKIMAFSTFSF